MKTNRLFWNSIIAVVLLCNIGCDQISKTIVRSHLNFHEQINLFDNRVMLTRVENSGAFLSLGDSLSSGVKFTVLIFIPFLSLLAGLYFLFSKSALSRSTLVALSFVVGGGIGNIMDRYLYGSVTDFLHIDFGILRTGIFNMADVSIMTGVFIIVGTYLVRRNNPLMGMEP
jgi:lipoprotein signal peptidase